MAERTIISHDLATGEIVTSTVAFEPPAPNPIELRLDAYRQNITVDELMEAVFEHFDGRPEKMNALLIRRAAIKAQYPKSEGK